MKLAWCRGGTAVLGHSEHTSGKGWPPVDEVRDVGNKEKLDLVGYQRPLGNLLRPAVPHREVQYLFSHALKANPATAWSFFGC